MIFGEYAKKLLKVLPPPSILTFDHSGLEISPEAVRLVHFKETKYGKIPKILKEVNLKTPCKTLESDEDLDSCTELKSVLNNLRTEFNLRYIISSLPEDKTYIFKALLPNESRDHIKETLLYKLEENVPLEPNSVIFDYAISPKTIDEKNFEVIVTVIPEDTIKTYTKLFHSCSLIPISFESESQALARSLVAQKDFSPYMILNITDHKVQVSIADEGFVQYASSLPISGKEVLADLNGNQARHLIENINRLLVYWFTTVKHPEDQEKIQAVIVTGQHASNTDLIKFISEHSNVQVTTGNVWQNCFSLDNYIPEIRKEDSNRYAIAIGLALTKV